MLHESIHGFEGNMKLRTAKGRHARQCPTLAARLTSYHTTLGVHCGLHKLVFPSFSTSTATSESTSKYYDHRSHQAPHPSRVDRAPPDEHEPLSQYVYAPGHTALQMLPLGLSVSACGRATRPLGVDVGSQSWPCRSVASRMNMT